MAVAPKKERGGQIDSDSRGRHRHHRRGANHFRADKALDPLPRDAPVVVNRSTALPIAASTDDRRNP